MMINEKIQYKGEINNFNYFFEIFRNSKLNVLFEDENLEFRTNFFNILLIEGTLLFDSKVLKEISEYLELDEDSSNYFLQYNNSESFKFQVSNHHENLDKRIKIGRKARNLVKINIFIKIELINC